HAAGDRASLVAYVLVEEDGSFRSEREIIAEVGRGLPAHMVPSAVVVLDEFPRTASGKLDTAALPLPALVGHVSRSAETEAERLVADVFASVLGLDVADGRDSIDAERSFFSLGGNSLLAVHVAARLTDATGMDVSVRDVFEHPAIATLATRLADGVDVPGMAREGGVPPAGPGDRAPLSPAQQQVWLEYRKNPDSDSYNIAFALTLRNDTDTLDIDALSAALVDLVDRHQGLRTVFVETEDGPRQVIRPTSAAATALAVDAVDEQECERAVAEVARRPFDLAVEFPFRAHLFTHGSGHHELVLVLHHIVADGGSLAPLARDLAEAYAARRGDAAPRWRPLPVHYRDYALWQQSRLGDDADPDSRAGVQLRYWADALSDLPPESLPPRDRPRPRPGDGSERRPQTSVVEFELPPEDRAGLAAVAEASGATEFMAVHAVLALLLSRLTGSDDVAIGTPVSGRGADGLQHLVGMFANTVVLRTQAGPDTAFTELLRRSRACTLDGLANADVPFGQVVQNCDPPRGNGLHPFFQMVLTVEDDSGPALALEGLDVSTRAVGNAAGKFDLELQARPGTRGELRCRLTFATALFDEVGMRNFGDRLVRVVEEVGRAPETVVGDVPILSAPEVAEVLEAPAAPVRSRTLAEILDLVARREPDRIAVIDGPRSMTYRELDAAANRLARALIAHGAGPGHAVAIAVGRSLESVLAVWAVARTGAAFVPVDTAYPAERVAHMLSDSGARIGLCNDPASGPVGPAMRWLPVNADGLDPVCAGFSSSPIAARELRSTTRPDQVAYIIYTSGTTGRPKGVLVTHAGLADLVRAQNKSYGVTPDSRVLHFASPGFDASMLEMLLAFGPGATLVVAPPDVYGGAELAGVLARQGITHAFVTPAALMSVDPAGLDMLRVIAVGGDVCPPALVERWARGGRTVLNAYGPTETTIVATMSGPLTAGDEVTIGHAVDGAGALVLDRRLHPVPDGVTGELYLSGPGLARGYRGLPALTASRFVAHPFGAPGERLYRTGDLVRRNRHHGLRYLGRADGQVKVRGFRIETEEVDGALAGHPAVRYAVSAVQDGRLVSYVVAEPGVDLSDVRARVRAVLPRQMVPAAITRVDELPMTTNGKLDRSGLPEPDFDGSAAVFVAPRTDLEKRITEVFGAVLGVRRVGVTDDLFDLGLDSLLATRAVREITVACGARIPVRVLFDSPTVAQLADWSEEAPESTDTPASVGVDVGRTDESPERPEFVPAAPAQRSLWVLEQVAGPHASYNIPLAVRMRGEVDADALRGAVRDLMVRHEPLRTVLPDSGAGPHQVVLPAPTEQQALTVRQVRGDVVDQVVYEEANRPFDITCERPFRAVLFTRNPGDHDLVLVLHHIAADGASLVPLTRDLAEFYAARSLGRKPDLPGLPVQYADYAVSRHGQLGSETDPTSEARRQLAYWQAMLHDAPEESGLPALRDRPDEPSGRGHEVAIPLGDETMRDLRRFARGRRATTFMVLHTALAVLLGRLGDDQDVTIGTPVAGRDDPRLQDLVGMFAGTIALRTVIDPAETFAESLRRVRDRDLAAFAHSDLPFEQVVAAVNPSRHPSRHPLFQVALSVFDAQSSIPDMPGLDVEFDEIATDTVKFDMQVTIRETAEGGVQARLAYAEDLYDGAYALRYARMFAAIIEQAVQADGDVAVGDIELLGADDIAETAPLHGMPTMLPELLPDLLTAAVAERSGAPALVQAGRTVTYDELDRRSNILARMLIARGAGPGTTVAVAVRRSIESVLCLWAVAKTGAAYLGVDRNYPAARVEHMLADSGVMLGVTVGRAPVGIVDAPCRWLRLDGPEFGSERTAASDAAVDDRDRAEPLRAEHPAYLVYTSGSTGTPKGVVVTHGGLANFASEVRERFAIVAESRTLHFASPSFDAAILEALLAFPAGATMVIAPADVYGGAELADVLADEHVTHAFITPAALDTVDPAQVPDLGTVLVGGEALRPDLAERWSRGRVLSNVYGPTETTIVTTMTRPVAGGQITIGGPIRGVDAMVLDTRLHPVPAGVLGELYFAGPQLARGYHGREAMTAARFVANPFGEPGSRMYRTGDLVRVRPDRSIEYVGRSDHQVKIRGFRIELPEIDAVLSRHADVAAAVTVPVDGPGGDTVLVSYVRPAPGAGAVGGHFDHDAVRNHVAATLPRHMVPVLLQTVSEIPLTPVGKLDRRALPAPRFEEESCGREPVTPVEKTICAAFERTLGRGHVAADDNFFELGGTSLSATRVVVALRESGQAELRDLRTQWLFTDSSPAALAARCEPAGDHSA
ncbi:MAG: amino acid adenylation domain-containing protein, partial [Tomitella sp.]|nr:amino acid adenylation domain-containing protein [Tomitella sp.]